MADIHKAAAIIIQDGALLVERSKGKEFFVPPGGKLEAGETAAQALIRELKEELSIDVQEAELEYFGTFTAEAANQPGKEVIADMFILTTYQGKIVAAHEVEELHWITSKIPADLKVGSICAHKVIPMLQARALIA